MGVINKESILNYCEEAKKTLENLMDKSMEMLDYRALDFYESKWMMFEFEIPWMLNDIEKGDDNDSNT